MKLLLKQTLSGPAGAKHAGDEIDVDDAVTAAAMIEKGIAEAKTKKEHEALMKKAAEAKAEAAEREARVKAEREAERLKAKLSELYAEVVDTEAALSGVVLSDADRKKMIDALEKRER